MREREQEILLFAVNARYTDALPSRMNFPHDFIKALSQVVLDQEKPRHGDRLRPTRTGI